MVGLISDENLLTMLRKHLQVVRTLSRRYSHGLANENPGLATKYLRQYLASGFNKQTRRDILEFHYGYLEGHVVDDFSTVIREEPLLWWHEGEHCTCSIRLSFNELDHREGDLSLVFFVGDIYLYEMSFTLAPGSAIGASAKAAMLIARVQGAKDRFDDIRMVTKDCGDIPPQLLLATVAFRIAETLNIDLVCGVSNGEQLWNKDKAVLFNYDAFWEKFEARKNGRGFFEIPIPYMQKPLDQVSATHRRRTRLKRELKARAAQVAGDNFRDKYLRSRPAGTATQGISGGPAIA